MSQRVRSPCTRTISLSPFGRERGAFPHSLEVASLTVGDHFAATSAAYCK